MQKFTLPNPKPIHHLDGVRAQVSLRTPGRLSAGFGVSRRLFGQLVLGGAIALLAGPFLTLAAQEPQSTQAPATAQKTTPESQAQKPEASTPAKPSHTSASHRHTAKRSSQQSSQHSQKEAEAKAAEEAAATPAVPPAPPPPDWPANHQPNPATVVWDSRGLEIQASNSSLGQILHDVATDTGAKLEGLGEGRNSDQRIFGNYGPGPARDVISKLLDGSGYNVLMIGGTGDQPPQQIILSTSAAGTPPPPNTAQQPSEQQQDEQDAQPEQNVEQDYRPPQYPMPARNPFGGPPPRTPQEMQQQIQQRQQQLEQLRQQQQQQGYPQQPAQQQQPQ